MASLLRPASSLSFRSRHVAPESLGEQQQQVVARAGFEMYSTVWKSVLECWSTTKLLGTHHGQRLSRRHLA